MITPEERAIGKLIEKAKHDLAERKKDAKKIIEKAHQDVDNDDAWGDDIAELFDLSLELGLKQLEIHGMEIAKKEANTHQDDPMGAIDAEYDREKRDIDEMEAKRQKILTKVFWETNSDPAQARSDYEESVKLDYAILYERAKLKGKLDAMEAASRR